MNSNLIKTKKYYSYSRPSIQPSAPLSVIPVLDIEAGKWVTEERSSSSEPFLLALPSASRPLCVPKKGCKVEITILG